MTPAQRDKLKRLCRYISRPPVATERLALTAAGQVRYTLNTPYRDGTTHLVLEPLDPMARLAALVPPPSSVAEGESARPPTSRHVAMCWARRLKRVCGIEIESCVRCGGTLRATASIEEPEVIARILAHLERMGLQQGQSELLQLWVRAPPVPSRLR